MEQVIKDALIVWLLYPATPGLIAGLCGGYTMRGAKGRPALQEVLIGVVVTAGVFVGVSFLQYAVGQGGV